MSYSKTNQTINNPVKLKHCPKCDQDLLVTNFSSTRAKFCINCKKIVELEQKQEMTARALGRSQKKKQKKQQVTSIADLKKSVQRVFNKFIRLRDKDLPCISCQKWSDKFDAGHYINQGSSGALRYNEENVHKQCSFKCNRSLSGNKIEYRIALAKKIGADRVEWLEQHRTDTKHWQREELENLLTTYQQKIKAMEWGERNPHEVKEMKADLEKSMDW